MNKEVRVKLKKDLDSIKVKYLELKRAKRKRDREYIESNIQYATKIIIEEYDLMNYDIDIKMESHNTKFFIFDVESILHKQEMNEEE